jgi:hypothetical protein
VDLLRSSSEITQEDREWAQSLADLPQQACAICHNWIREDGIEAHIRTVHSMELAEYRQQYGSSRVVRTTYIRYAQYGSNSVTVCVLVLKLF